MWLQYQCLWDMQAENIYNRLGEDLTKWQALLVQIRKARGTFDNAETRKEFGPVVIDYGKVIMTYSCRCCIRTIFHGGEKSVIYSKSLLHEKLIKKSTFQTKIIHSTIILSVMSLVFCCYIFCNKCISMSFSLNVCICP